MLENYLSILIYMGLAVAIGVILIVLGALISPRKPTPEKLSQYECGFPPFEDARLKFDVRFLPDFDFIHYFRFRSRLFISLGSHL